MCGKPECRCVRRKDPIKHGPYHYLSYTFEGKSHTGGDEFAALLPQTTLEEVQALAERVCFGFGSHSFAGEAAMDIDSLTFSIGVAGCAGSADSSVLLIEAADQARWEERVRF